MNHSIDEVSRSAVACCLASIGYRSPREHSQFDDIASRVESEVKESLVSLRSSVVREVSRNGMPPEALFEYEMAFGLLSCMSRVPLVGWVLRPLAINYAASKVQLYADSVAALNAEADREAAEVMLRN